ncbi:hypothetical protein B2J93_4600 [Marssonina coronariae]|uniref:Uncharacterized protein n=1 Tax=Diplocarpon coronariae TaxID=2795749 RepID=A0A218Z2S1_9HELO|nr:hypothetical protein B2J93_4600 [Marssonina coronariae]
MRRQWRISLEALRLREVMEDGIWVRGTHGHTNQVRAREVEEPSPHGSWDLGALALEQISIEGLLHTVRPWLAVAEPGLSLNPCWSNFKNADWSLLSSFTPSDAALEMEIPGSAEEGNQSRLSQAGAGLSGGVGIWVLAGQDELWASAAPEWAEEEEEEEGRGEEGDGEGDCVENAPEHVATQTNEPVK